VLFLTRSPIPESVLPELGAEVAAYSGRLSIIPPSRHPSGAVYTYIRPPADELAVVDIDALGWALQPKDGPSRKPGSTTRAHREPPPPVDEQQAGAFAWLFAGLGLYPGQGAAADSRGEFFLCPWHPDTEPSLHILWVSAIFYCQGCGRSGGLRALRRLVEGDPDALPRKFPNDESGVPFGNRGTNRGAESLVEQVAALADQLPPSALNVTGRQLRECRQYVLTYQCDAGHEFAPRDERGNPTPLSCDASAGICPRCGTARFLRDALQADAQLSERVHVFRLIAQTPGRELFDLGLSGRLTARLKTYRQNHGLTAGSTARSLHLDPDGAAFRGHFILAVPCDDAVRVVGDGAFAMEDLGACTLSEWHRWQIDEQLSALARLETPEQLDAFYQSMHGQQQFRHFGSWYGERTVDADTGEVTTPKNAGGAGSAKNARVGQVICPLHPHAQVRRSTQPVPITALVRSDGGMLVPRPPDAAAVPTGGAS
jgi:hypothetical protein